MLRNWPISAEVVFSNQFPGQINMLDEIRFRRLKSI